MTMRRSVLAIFVGLMTISVAGIGSDSLFMRLLPSMFGSGRRVDDPIMLTVMLASDAVFLTLGGYLTARFARRAPLKHAVVLALLQALAVVVALPELSGTAPTWFHVMSIVVVIPAVVAGALAAERSSSETLTASPAAL